MTAREDDLIRDTVDLHYHSGPSPFPRRLDPVESAKHFDEHGFKAVVYKSHHHNMVMDVLSIKASVLDSLRVRIFGGIALNGIVGGLNPRAVEMCLRMGGKIVWFPTISSPGHIEYHRHGGGFPEPTMKLMPEAPNPVLGDDGKLKPAVHDIIQARGGCPEAAGAASGFRGQPVRRPGARARAHGRIHRARCQHVRP